MTKLNMERDNPENPAPMQEKDKQVSEDSMSWKGDVYAIGYIFFWIAVAYVAGRATDYPLDHWR